MASPCLETPDTNPMPEPSYSIDDFQARFPDLQRRGRELAGPCPLCGGEDRFHVNQDGVFGCRGCIDDDALQARENVKAIFQLLEGEVYVADPRGAVSTPRLWAVLC